MAAAGKGGGSELFDLDALTQQLGPTGRPLPAFPEPAPLGQQGSSTAG